MTGAIPSGLGPVGGQTHNTIGSSTEPKITVKRVSLDCSSSVEKTDENRRNFLSQFPSKVRQWLTDCKKGIGNWGTSIRRWFDNLKQKTGGSEQQIRTTSSTSQTPALIAEQKRLAELNKLTDSEKYKRLSELIEFLSNPYSLQQEGIFRLSGSVTKKVELVEKLSQETFELQANLETDVVTGAMKELIVSCQFSLPVLLEADTNDQKIKDKVGEMPLEKQQAFKELLQFFGEVAKNKEQNKMDASNLAICIAPRLPNSPGVAMRSLIQAAADDKLDEFFPKTQ